MTTITHRVDLWSWYGEFVGRWVIPDDGPQKPPRWIVAPDGRVFLNLASPRNRDEGWHYQQTHEPAPTGTRILTAAEQVLKGNETTTTQGRHHHVRETDDPHSLHRLAG